MFANITIAPIGAINQAGLTRQFWEAVPIVAPRGHLISVSPIVILKAIGSEMNSANFGFTWIGQVRLDKFLPQIGTFDFATV